MERVLAWPALVQMMNKMELTSKQGLNWLVYQKHDDMISLYM